MNPPPEDYHSISPYPTVTETARLIEFSEEGIRWYGEVEISPPDGVVSVVRCIADALSMKGELSATSRLRAESAVI